MEALHKKFVEVDKDYSFTVYELYDDLEDMKCWLYVNEEVAYVSTRDWLLENMDMEEAEEYILECFDLCSNPGIDIILSPVWPWISETLQESNKNFYLNMNVNK